MFKRFPRGLVASLSALALLVVSAAGGSRAASSSPPVEGVSFNLKTVEGGSITSEMLRGDVVVLAFGASWLPIPRAQVQGVQQLAEEFAARDVRVYWVSTDSDKPQSKNYATDDQLRAFARRNALKIAVLRDPDGTLFKTLGVERNQLPAIVIIDKQGNVSESIGGFASETSLVEQLSPRLNKLLGSQ
ncbi:MAG TPA: TlpA disulfide reductase family protein [Pyrinomonadaceae bacterium]|nr:TlpA disulfide reductase family protein [Pyrinomonadaceae bacterium]